MAIVDKTTRTCELDEKGCLRLDQILNAFHAPIGEEQAWALCYQTAKCIAKELVSGHPFCVSDIGHVYIHKDGSVHEKTVYSTEYGPTREHVEYEHEMVKSLGVVIFHALDFGLREDCERLLGASLEALIERMTSVDEEYPNESLHHQRVTQDEHPDEGIGLDEHHSTKSGSEFTMATVMQMCAEKLERPTQADTHYKAVCRALVAEVLELSKFLEQVAMGTEELRQLKSKTVPMESSSHLEELKVQDWARLWMQVIRELRQGVKLKKVQIDDDLHPIEYELTPYEMLLDDIRSRRYTLRKIMVNGNLPPRVKKDAHALILEFIRSRPPLVPVSKRVLAPEPVKQVSLYERLMASIRQQHKLRHVPPPTTASSEKSSPKQQAPTPQPDQPRRRLIKPDLSLRLSISFDDDDDLEIPDSPGPESKEPMSLPAMPLQEQLNGHSPVDRRHSVPGCDVVERPSSLNMNGQRRKGRKHSPYSPSAQYYENYWTCSNWRSLECLSLTLEEVVHIRNVLTKAELEAVVGNRDMYEKLVKGKICFICKSKEFGIVIQRAKRCKLCERRVCDNCSVKMRVPTENFAKIPVYMLSPSPSPPHDVDPNSQPFFRMDSHKLESFEDSFETSDSDEGDVSGGKPTTKPTSRLKKWGSFNENDSSKRKRAPLERSKTISVRQDPLKDSYVDLKGPPAFVCRDCKALVRHIIDTSQSKEPLRPKPSAGPLSCVSFCLSPLAESPGNGPSASQKVLG